MWIEGEGPHDKAINSTNLIAMEIRYKGGSSTPFCLIGITDQTELFIKGFANEQTASKYLKEVIEKINLAEL